MTSLLSLLVVGSAAIPRLALGQEATAQPIVVTANAESDSATSPSINEAEKQKQAIIGGLTIKNVDDLNLGRAANFEDLLPRVPGLFLQTENGNEVSKISIRGSGIDAEDEPVGVMVLLDGLTYNQGDGEVLLEDIDVDSLRHAEVFRGAAAFNYGSTTLGGAINLVPATGYDSAPLELRLEAGSYGYLRGRVSTGDVAGPVDYFASLAARERDGFREHSAENSQIFFGDLGWKLSKQWENRLYVTLDRTDRDLAGGLTQQELQSNPRQADPDAITQDWNKSWTYSRVADRLVYDSEDLDFAAGAFWFHRDLTERGFYSPQFREGIDQFYSDNFSGDVRIVLRPELFRQRTIITAGISPQLEYENAQSYENLNGRPGATTSRGENISINAPSYLDVQQYLTSRWSVVGGAQFISAQRRYVDRFDDPSVGDQSHRQNFTAANPKLGMIYEIDRKTQLFTNVSRSWQPPTLDNLASFTEGENSALTFTPLAAQHAWTAEVGTRGEYGPVEWDLALYEATVRDELLELNDANGNEIGTTNVRRSKHRGVEAQVDIDLLQLLLSQPTDRGRQTKFLLQQTYTLNDFHFDRDAVYGDNRIAGIPAQLYEMQLLYQSSDGFCAGPNLNCNLTRYPVDQANSLYVDPYLLLGFKIGYQGRNWSAFVEAENLTDERYPSAVDAIGNAQTSDGPRIFHPGDGRSIYGGVGWTW